MARAVYILVLLGLIVAGALYLADLGGTVEVRIGDAWIGTSAPVALLALCLLFLLLHGILNGIGAIRRWPSRWRAHRAAKRRDTGDAALTRALVALAAGTAEVARVEVRRARNALGDTPQILLLAAEADRLSGRERDAEAAFRALAGRADSRFLGLRGLLRQAIARQDWDAALALAKEAEAVQPGASWLREERATLALRTQDWREALALAPPETPRAALALAAADQEADPAKATELERQAFQADHGFVPAALRHAERLRQAGSPRRARGVLEEAWAAAPHPDLAPPYLAEEPDPLHQVKLVEQLARRNPQHVESRLLMARIALAAGLTGRARAELTALLDAGQADRRAYLLLAELEDAEHGDTAEARAAQARWLREAARAMPEPQWRCAACGTEHPRWTPVCTACDSVGRISWTAPHMAAVAVASNSVAH